MRKFVKLIRGEKFPNRPYDLTAQLPIESLEDMTELAGPLLEEIDGIPGLGYTASFLWEDVEKVQAFFEERGYTIGHKDDRAHDRALIAAVRAMKEAGVLAD